MSTVVEYAEFMATRSLSSADLALWRSFRRVADRINAAIERELMAATGISGADHGVITRLAESKGKVLRQHELAASMRWDRTRLSHHLTRMEQRGFVERKKLAGGGTAVAITAQGERARKAADPVHAAIVSRRFISKLTPSQREAIASLAQGEDQDQEDAGA